MNNVASILAFNAVVVAGLMFLVWLLSVVLRDASVVDCFWGLGFALVACVTFWLVGFGDTRSLVQTALVVVWGVRLSGYLIWRNYGRGEDYRYRQMRAKHGDRFAFVSLFTVFGLQGVILWFVSLPVQVGQTLGGHDVPSVLDGIGIALWGIGIFFEAVGDYQLAQFKADPTNQGRVLKTGLWGFTRHPNYFGDACVWWGIYFLAWGAGAWWTVLSPLLMTVLLVKVSGVALLERTIGNRRPEYEDYVRTTSAFFPWPPQTD